MQDLNYELKQLCSRNRDGSFVTQTGRERMLTLIANQLREMGFVNMRAQSLEPRHVEKLVERWAVEGLSPGTLKNRMTELRWWAEKIGKTNVVAKTNDAYGIANRRYVTNVSNTSSGMVILAHMSPDARNRVLADLAPAERRKIGERVSAIARKGFERRSSSMVQGVLNLSVPVFDHAGVIGAMTMAYIGQVNQRVSPEKALDEVIAGAAQLSGLLGGELELRGRPGIGDAVPVNATGATVIRRAVQGRRARRSWVVGVASLLAR